VTAPVLQSCQLPASHFLPWLPAEHAIHFQGLIFPDGHGLPNHKPSLELALAAEHGLRLEIELTAP